MAISELVNVSITETAAGTTLASFDIPAILAGASDTTPASYSAVRAVRYTLDAAGLQSISDDWGSGSDAYATASAMAAQEPRPEAVYIIKRGAPVAIVKTITITGTILSGQSLAVTVNGVAFPVTFASTSSATMDAFAAAIQAGGNGVATAAHSTGVITITATSEYELSVSAVTVTGAGTHPTFAVATSVAGRTAADDLADALAEDDTNLWYGLVAADTDTGLQLSLAAAIETTEKFFWLQTSESASKTSGGSTALAIQLAALNYRRTLGFWHHDTEDHIDAAAMAYYLGNDPGSIDLCNTELAGVTVNKTSSLTAAEVAVLEGRNFNSYRKFGPYGAIRTGVRVDGVVAEATRDLDYARNEYRSAFITYLTQTKKPSYDTAGIGALEAIGESVTRRLVSEGVFRGDKTASFTVPKLADISEANQAARLVPNCVVNATLLKGVIKVEIPLNIVV